MSATEEQPSAPESPAIQCKPPEYIEAQLVVPTEIPLLKILCVSDTHDQQAYLPHDLPTADILCHAGDFSCR